MYLDSAYVVKYYVNEPDSSGARDLIRQADLLTCSSLALIEVTCVFHRHIREGSLSPQQGQQLMAIFREHADAGMWNLIPVSNALLGRTAKLVQGLATTVPLRSGDAIHLATALEVGEREIWTTDRHLLAAAAQVGLIGRRL